MKRSFWIARGFIAFCIAVSGFQAVVSAQVPDSTGARGLAAAGEPDPAGQDVLLLAPLRPLVVRLRVTIDGKPFRQVWREGIDRLFDDSDRDGDGYLNGGDSGELTALAAGAAASLDLDSGQVAAALAEMATQQPSELHGKLGREAVVSYFERTAPAFATLLVVGPSRPARALFPLLDADGDGQLTAAELQSAATRLGVRDFDDDEIITERELATAASSSAPATASQSDGLVGAGPVYLLDRGADPSAVADLLARYGPGPWDGIGRRRPDFELEISLGKVSSRSSRRRSAGGGEPSDVKIKRKLDGSYQLDLGDSRIELRRNNRDPSRNPDRELRFANFDADNNGYLDADEAESVPRLAESFALIDADADGMVFPAEFEAYFARQNKAAASRLLLEVLDQGQELFTLLDQDRDGRLTPRELRAGAKLLLSHDTNGDARLGATEVPQNLRLELSRGTPAQAQTAAAGRVAPARGAGRLSDRQGPVWFQKMDRNADGDLSLREFLGPLDVFSRLDRNQDGLLDPSEAQQAGAPAAAGQ